MFVPDGVVTNERMSKLMDTTDDWIVQRTGIRERRYARRGTSSADLGFEAARRALSDAGLSAADLDLIVFATMTPAHYFPGNGGLLAARLGLTTTQALDIRMQCAGFLSGLQVADAFIRSGQARRVLLVGAECHAAFFPWSEKDWGVLFGDSEGPASPEAYAWGTTHRDRAVIFGDAGGAFVLEGVGQPKDRAFVRGIEFHRTLKFGGGGAIVSGAVIYQAEAEVAGCTGIAERNRLVAFGAGVGGPLLLLGQRVLSPVGLAERGLGHAKTRIELQGGAQHDDRVLDVFRVGVIQ